MKRLAERVTTIEHYLRDVSERDQHGRLSPKFRESRQNSVDDSDISKCTYDSLVCANLASADQHVIEPGGERVIAIANADGSRSYGTPDCFLE